LKNFLKPTGDSTCPPDVIRAKHIQGRIEERMIGAAELNEDAEVLECNFVLSDDGDVDINDTAMFP
jgi:hypothetical protein